MWKNCAFDDTSMEFRTLLEHPFRKIFRYRGVPDLSQARNGGHFTKWSLSGITRCMINGYIAKFSIKQAYQWWIFTQVDTRLVTKYKKRSHDIFI